MNNISGFYPTLALFSLALEFGLPSLMVASRLDSRFILYAFFRKTFHLFYLLIIILIFLGSCYIFKVNFLDNLLLFFIFVIYGYFGLACSIAKGIYDRSKSIKKGLLLRYVTSISAAIGFYLSISGFGDYIALVFVSLSRFPYVFVAINLLNRFKTIRIEKKNVDLAFSRIKSMFTATVMTFSSDFLYRIYASFIFSVPEIIFYSFAAEIATKMSGFLFQSIQPFYFQLMKFFSRYFLFTSTLMFFIPLLNNSYISIIGVSSALFITALLLQKLIELNLFQFRIYFSFLQFIIFALTVTLGQYFNWDYSVIDFWLISQIFSIYCVSSFIFYNEKN